MVRIKRGVTARKRHKKILKATKGYRGLRNRLFRQAKNAWMKAGMHAYKGRKIKKRDYRALWITRISAGLKQLGYSYSRFIYGMQKNDVILNRKILADLAAQHPGTFAEVAKTAMSK